MGRSFKSRLLAISMLATTIGVIAAPGSHAGSNPPSLRLFPVLNHVEVQRFEADPELFVSPGMYVAPVGGAFEIDASVASNRTVTLWLVTRDGNSVHRVRQITTPTPVSLEEGLPSFFHAVLKDGAGHSVADGDSPFCPSGGFGLSRVDASGPDKPSYPYYCGSQLTRGMVWGLDNGWASSIFVTLAPADAPDGDYTLTVGIADTYRKQLGISTKSSTATIGVTLTTITDGGPCPREIICEPGPRAAAAPQRSGAPNEGPRNAGKGEKGGNDGVHHGGPGGTPDMAALPAHSFGVEHNEEDGHDYLDFGATIWNAGSGPLVVEGFRNGGTPIMKATQFIYKDGKPSRSSVIGEFEFDTRPGHDHWHMEDVAQYDLLDAGGSRIVLSEKQSFCLAPTDPIDLTRPGADWQPDRLGLWSSCAGSDSIWLREVLPAGWGDTYYQSVAGQSFDITNLANGRYIVRVTTNPFKRIIETSYTNNASTITVEIGGTPGNRTVDTV